MQETVGKEAEKRLVVESVRRVGGGVVVEVIEEIMIYGQRLQPLPPGASLPPGLVRQRFDPEKMGAKFMEMMDKMERGESPFGGPMMGTTQNISHVYMPREDYLAAGSPVPGDYVKLTLEKVKD